MGKSNSLRPGPVAIGVLIASVVAIALYLAIRKPPYQVDLAKVTRGPMAVTINDEGETRVRDLFVVAAPINGRLLRIQLEAGDPVIAGRTVVARMAPTDPDFLDRRTESRARAQVEALDDAISSAVLRTSQARAARNLAANEQQRVAALYKRGFATRAALDRADTARREAEAALGEAARMAEAARHDRDAARASLISPLSESTPMNPLEVRSPVSGTVMRIARESEAIVPAGSSLVELGDAHNLEIVTDLMSADAVRISPGANVLIDNWGGTKPLRGRVRRIEPFGFTKISALGVEEQRVNVIIGIADPPALWSRLGHGYRVIVRIEEWSGQNVVRVPVSAVFRDKGGWAAFSVNGSRAELTPVKIGRMNDEVAEVLGGLAPSTAVILHPSEKITDGARVEAR